VPTRRDLVLGAAAGLGLAGCGGGDEEPPPMPPAGPGGNDLRIAGFALQLEVLERDLYAELARRGPLSGEERGLARAFGEQEAEHADRLTAFIRDAGGEPPGPLPADIRALTSGSRRTVLRRLADIEDLGAAAYLGGAPQLLNRDALAMALAIHTVEGRHAATWRRRLGEPAAETGAFASPLTARDVGRRLRALLDGERS
jgi:hypothetical protein